MRVFYLMLFALLATACSRGERPNPIGFFTLEPGKVERRFGCHVALDDDFKVNGFYASVSFACRVPESAKTQDRWWGDQQKPMVFSLDEGDCILLELAFFCVEKIRPMESVTFRETYMTENSNAVIKHLPRRR
jgi:hypothetical protein